MRELVDRLLLPVPPLVERGVDSLARHFDVGNVENVRSTLAIDNNASLGQTNRWWLGFMSFSDATGKDVHLLGASRQGHRSSVGALPRSAAITALHVADGLVNAALGAFALVEILNQMQRLVIRAPGQTVEEGLI